MALSEVCVEKDVWLHARRWLTRDGQLRFQVHDAGLPDGRIHRRLILSTRGLGVSPLGLGGSIDGLFPCRRHQARLVGRMRFLLILQLLLQAIHPLQQSFQHIRLWPTLLWNRIYGSISHVRGGDSTLRTVYAGALEDLTRFACWPQPIAFDLGKIISNAENLLGVIAHLSFAARLAIHRFSRFAAHATDGQALDAHLRTCRHGGWGSEGYRTTRRSHHHWGSWARTAARGAKHQRGDGSSQICVVMLAGLLLLVHETAEEKSAGLTNNDWQRCQEMICPDLHAPGTPGASCSWTRNYFVLRIS